MTTTTAYQIVRVGNPRTTKTSDYGCATTVAIQPRRNKVLPINKKKMSNPSSRIEAFNVRPRICNPLECRDNLNILKTLTSRITLRIARDMAWLVLLSCGFWGALGKFIVGSSSSAITVASVMKYGMMAIISIVFITSLKKCNLLGQARKRTDSSNVNHTIQIVSIRKNGSVMSGTSSSSIFVPFVVVLNTL